MPARGGATRGRGRGRGVTLEELEARKAKEQNKARAANHSRKRGHDKKLRQSMGYMPPS